MQLETQPFLEAYKKNAGSLPGASLGWMQDVRDEALGRFKTLGFPTVKSEAWKYTNLIPWMRTGFNLAQGNTQAAPSSFGDFDRYAIVLSAGTIASASNLPKGVFVTSVADLAQNDPEKLKQYYAAFTLVHEQGMSAFTNAFFQNGVVVDVAPGVVVDKPIEVVYLGGAEAERVHFCNVVRLGQGARATFIERADETSEQTNWLGVLQQIILGDSSHLTHYKLQLDTGKRLHLSESRVRQAAHSHYDSHLISLGAALVRNEIDQRFEGEGGSCRLNGVFFGQGSDHIDNRTVIDHQVSHCTSEEYYKGIVKDKATGIFDGKVMVRQDAQQTRSAQSSKNLLLSESATLNARPQLEIYADDVKCSHGATTGQLDETALFYLRSRGIEANEARQMLVESFLLEIVDRIDLVPLRDALRERLSMASTQPVKDLP